MRIFWIPLSFFATIRDILFPRILHPKSVGGKNHGFCHPLQKEGISGTGGINCMFRERRAKPPANLLQLGVRVAVDRLEDFRRHESQSVYRKRN